MMVHSGQLLHYNVEPYSGFTIDCNSCCRLVQINLNQLFEHVTVPFVREIVLIHPFTVIVVKCTHEYLVFR